MRLIPIFTLALIIMGGCSNTDCSGLREDFDTRVQRSMLPIRENNQSLCHGMNMGSDFTTLAPQWGVGTLIDYNETTSTGTFLGNNETHLFFLPNTTTYVVGETYKIDMMNICRQFFLLADSRYPSPLRASIKAPTTLTCKYQ